MTYHKMKNYTLEAAKVPKNFLKNYQSLQPLNLHPITKSGNNVSTMKTITLTQDELYCLLNDAFIYKADLEAKKEYHNKERPYTPAHEISEFIKSHIKIKHLQF